VYGTQIINSRSCFIGCLASLEKSGLPYHVYAKEKKEKGKKGKRGEKKKEFRIF
jgi:hypothetical protein